MTQNCGMAVALIVLLVFVCCTNTQVKQEANIDPNAVKLAKGCPDTTYDDWQTSDYVLPYAVGESYVVVLSHCSGSYHSEGRPDQYAIDFEMPIGTSVTASRAGSVVFVEESGEDGGFPNNVVAIRHEDQTVAEYMHLTKNGAMVRVGDEVAQGQEIGLSGNTGLAGYAHLHFVVTERGFSYPYISIPTTFKNTAPNERSLASYTRYTALPY